jgi:Zn-dependent protease/CBS domain-containing protein
MPGSYRIGTLGGIEIYVNVSWIIAIVLLAFSAATGWFPSLYPGQSYVVYLIMGLVSAFLLFLSVLLHELAHSLVAKAKGVPVKSIVLFIFGGVSNFEQEAPTAGIDFLISIVGPLTSLALAVLFFLLWQPLANHPSAVSAILTYLAATNLILGIFNLIPGFPLDGGRVLRAIVWKITGKQHKATNAAVFVGEAIAYLFIVAGIWWLFSGSVVDGLWLGFIGWFLLSAAQSVHAQSRLEEVFKGVTVEQVMSKDFATVPANVSVQRLVDEHMLTQGLRSAMVMQGEQFAGLVSLSDVRHVPREEWGNTPVGLIMVQADKLHVVSPQQNVLDVLPLMNGVNVNQLPVVQDRKLLGVLTREGVLRSLEIRRSLKGRR